MVLFHNVDCQGDSSGYCLGVFRVSCAIFVTCNKFTGELLLSREVLYFN